MDINKIRELSKAKKIETFWKNQSVIWNGTEISVFERSEKELRWFISEFISHQTQCRDIGWEGFGTRLRRILESTIKLILFWLEETWMEFKPKNLIRSV